MHHEIDENKIPVLSSSISREGFVPSEVDFWLLELQVLKFKFCLVKLGLEQQINLQITGKILLKLDSN